MMNFCFHWGKPRNKGRFVFDVAKYRTKTTQTVVQMNYPLKTFYGISFGNFFLGYMSFEKITETRNTTERNYEHEEI